MVNYNYWRRKQRATNSNLSDEEKDNLLTKTIDLLGSITTAGASLFTNLGQNMHGVVITTNAHGFKEPVQTVNNYDLLQKGAKFSAVTKGLLFASVGLGIFDAVRVGSQNTEDPNAGTKRLIRNMVTIGATYTVSTWGGTLGAEAGTIAGASIGSAIEPVGGTTVGGAIGAATGYTAGSVLGAVIANKVCNYIFEEKLKW